MRQVLFWIPLKPFEWLPSWWPDARLPIFGYGMMLFVTFVVCTWYAGRRARNEGIAPRYIHDLAVWIFLGGLVGARTVYMIQYRQSIDQFFRIWEGGIVFYGSALGGLVGYALAYLLIIRRHGLSSGKLMDIIAPAAAIGLAIGRVGCLLNGCCFGSVACEQCPAVRFPMSSPARYSLVREGYQTSAGFVLGSGTSNAMVRAVEDGSPAAVSGLRANDVIVSANGQAIRSAGDLRQYLWEDWPRGQSELQLDVRRGEDKVAFPAFRPLTLGLQPTQIYESISMLLLFSLLTAFRPFRRHFGELMVLFMLGYSIHRFLDEMLRNDTEPVAFNMTLSQNGSLVLLAAGLVVGFLLLRQPVPVELQTHGDAPDAKRPRDPGAEMPCMRSGLV
jgi:phosphatidylglycerol:prolipoprotein diacylglycerol transferase